MLSVITIFESINKPYRERVGVYIFKENKLLVGKIKTSSWSGYVVPGGGVDPGESLEDAAIRESKEELGVSIKNLKLISTNVKIKYDKEDKKYCGYNNSFFTADYDKDDTSLFNSEGDGYDKVEITIPELISFFKLHAKKCEQNNDMFNSNTALLHIKNLNKLK